MVSYADLYQDPIEISDEIYKDNMCRQVSHIVKLNPFSYETYELEDIVDKVHEFEEYRDKVDGRVNVDTGCGNLWLVSQMHMFHGMLKWSTLTLEEIDDLFNIHEELKDFIDA
jgi:hypothetical protein